MRTLVSLFSFFVFHMICLGAATPVVCMRLEAAGWTGGLLALTLSGHHVGFALVAIFCPRALTIIGLRGSLIIASVSLCASMILQSTWSHPMGIALGRTGGGAATALACLVIETGLGYRAQHRRGLILGVYMILGNVAYSIGTSITGIYPEALPIATTCAAMALIPALLLRRDRSMTAPSIPAPPTSTVAEVGSRQQGRILATPQAIRAALGGGSATTAMLIIAPLQATQLGLSPPEITTYLTSIALSGAMFPVPLGMVADRFRHQLVLQLTAGLAGSMSLLATIAPHAPTQLGLMVLSTGLCFALYPLGLGLVHNQLPQEHTVHANRSLLLAAATGSLLGAPMSGLLVDLLGPTALTLWVGLSAMLACGSFRRSACSLPCGDAR